MLFSRIKNYADFKQKSEACNRDLGNKILLSLWRDRNIVKKYFLACKRGKPTNFVTWDDDLGWWANWLAFPSSTLRLLQRAIYQVLGDEDLASEDANLGALDKCVLAGRWIYTRGVYTDDHQGLCEDGSVNFIRYKNNEGKVYKMKDGKFIRKILEQNKATKTLPEQVKVWFCEEFCIEWRAYVAANSPLQDEVKLVVDDDFKSIYDSSICKGDFCSCMVDEDQYTFYDNAVAAKAASIRKMVEGHEIILARCVIFTHVRDCNTGEQLRLAERQYSRDGNLMLKRLLINKLIEAGEIDGYKEYSAGCSDSQAFLSNSGESWSHRYFKVCMNLSPGDTLSYQDSFKWYDMDENVAYNFEEDDCDDLATTNYEYETERVWSEREQSWLREEDAHWSCGMGDYIPAEDAVYAYDVQDWRPREDCTYIENIEEYVTDENVVECDECGDFLYKDKCLYSDLTDEYYCCERCMDEAEERYAKEYGYVRNENGEWVKETKEETIYA